MKNIYFTFFIYFLISQSFIFSSASIKLKKNITSILNTTDIITFNERIMVSTNGGLYSIVNQNYEIHNDALSIYDISCLAKENDKLWIGSNTYGTIQILNSNLKLIKTIDYPSFDRIIDIVFTNDHAYSIVLNDNEYFIARYLVDDMQYLDIIDLVDGKINDIKVYNNHLYILTDEGYYKSPNINDDNYLSLSQEWDGPHYNKYDILSLEVISEDLIFVCFKDNEYYSIYNDHIHPLDNLNDEFINTYNIGNILYLLSTKSLYILNPSSVESLYLQEELLLDLQEDIVIEELNDFNSYTFFNNAHFFGLENSGILIYANDAADLLIPNTIYKNQFDAIDYTEDGNLIGVANHGVNSYELSGGFIFSNGLSDNIYKENIHNFYSWPSNEINKYTISNSFYKTDVLKYWFGGKSSYSIVSIGDQIYFSNSGIYNETDINNVGWDPLVNFYDYYASEVFSFSNNPEYNELNYGGLVSLELSNLNDFTLGNVWSMHENILDGNYGILGDDKPYITINQINKDSNNNLYIVNPNAEKYNRPIVIKQNDSDIFRHIDNDLISDNAFLPTEIAFDKFNNIWVGFKYHQLSSGETYSSGGIRMIAIHDIEDEEFDWYNPTASPISSPLSDDLYHANVFSIDIGKDNYNNDILWVLTDRGVQGYILYSSYSISGNYSVDFVKINNNFYFTNLSFEEGDKVRVDNQNNAWITTKNEGLFIIRNDGTVWSENNSDAINYENYELLSNIVYDIDFDNLGNVFIATELGISVLETSFSQNKHPKNISVSPNPFRIGIDNEIIFTNIPKESTIKIMNLSGIVMKDFFVSKENRTFNWNGTDNFGNYLNTGVYLVSIYHHTNGESGVTKLAIIK